ncbi:hypothetical protein WJX84_008794 [Apatococcus fuscideae]|uniref:protein disulfide-isomerase n=1 Tax=Apatococcus fuscideae TaxID=2026836 RepID=A0AAW1T4H8_9CHLO
MYTRHTLLWCFCGALVVTQAAALYGRKSAVQVLDAKSFDKVVLQQDVAAVVEFFAPWCGHCKSLAPTYEKVAQHLQGIATVGAVDCDNDRNKPLCSRYQVQGFPTLKVFPAQARQSTSTNKRPSKSPTDYQGPRTAKGIAEAATAQIPSKYIKRIKGKADLDHPTPPQEDTSVPAPLALLFTDKAASSALYRSLSLRFLGRIAFAEARDTDNADLIEEYRITKFPTLVVRPADGDDVTYEGDLKPAPLVEFFKGFVPAGNDSSKAAAGEAPEEEKPKKAKKEPKVPDVVRNLTLSDVAGLAEMDDAFLLASFASGPTADCAAEAKAFNKLAFDLQDIIGVGQVNLTEAEARDTKAVGVDISQLTAKPCTFHLSLLPYGEKPEPDEWAHFTGEQTAKAVQAFVSEAYPAALVPRLATMDSMQAFLHVEVASPKIVLFTSKAETPGIFRALAANMRNTTFLFADVSAESVGILEQFGIKKVPAMALAFLDKPDDAPGMEGGGKLRLQVYPGPLKYPLMAAYLTAAAEALGFAEASEETGPGSLGSSKPKPVSQATTTTQLVETCPPSSSVCIFGLFDAASQEHAAAVGMLESAAGRHGSFSFAWVDSPTQPTFTSGFGLGQADVPTVVAASPKRERYQRLKGAMSLTAINSLIEGLATGKGHSIPFQELPQLVDGGETGAGEALEEDFDLSDIMGQEFGAGGLSSKEARLQEIEAQLQAEEAAKKDLSGASSQKAGKKKKRKAKKSASKDEL